MRSLGLRSTLIVLVAAASLATACMNAQTKDSMDGTATKHSPLPPEKRPSPPATASVMLDGKAITINYSKPSIRGRKIMGGLVPYGTVWRTGANEATAMTTATDLMIGDLHVPAGSYTLYTLPTADGWKLIVNKQTGQWGTVYDEKQDLGRVDMKVGTLASPQEVMSMGFEDTSGKKSVLHLKWETTDVSVPFAAM